MKKLLLSALAAVALSAAPAFAADMPVKAKKMVAPVYVSPWDLAFGVAMTSDYELRGISQSGHRPAIQGYFEGRYNAADWLQLYAGVWGSSLYTGFADAEFDISGGGRFTFGNFGLDLGYVYYGYPGPAAGVNISYGEFYAKPTYKVADWLTVGAFVTGGSDFGNGVGIVGSKDAYFYGGNAFITLPWAPLGVTLTLNPEIGRQWYSSGVKTSLAFQDYTWWDVGLILNYKAVTLDLRYWDTNVSTPAAGQCVAAAPIAGNDLCSAKFVATLKFDTTFSALK
ncbi:MAG: TorF family putative porin [Pseudolabrys sp.]|jgi:uncharacterized protein (TIGR02001 family)